MLVIGLGACGRGGQKAASEPNEPVVARVGDTRITARELSAQLARQPPAVRAHYGSMARRKDFLDSQIQVELLAAEARKRGFDRDPDFQRAVKQQLVSTFLQRAVEQELKPADVPEADVEKYFRDHPSEFNQPEVVRVSQIVVGDKRKAKEVLAKVKALAPDDTAGFAKLVAAHSEDKETMGRGGDMGMIQRDTAAYPKPVVTAAFALKEPNEVGGPVQSERGFHILRLTQRRPGSSRTYAEVKEELRQRLYQQMRARKMDDLLASIKQSTKVEIFEPELAKLVIDTGSKPPH